jgi:hypothetical protein
MDGLSGYLDSIIKVLYALICIFLVLVGAGAIYFFTHYQIVAR